MDIASGWFGGRPRLASAQLRESADLGFTGVALLPGDPELSREGLSQARRDTGLRFTAAALDALQEPDRRPLVPDLAASDRRRQLAAMALLPSTLDALQALGARIVIAPGGWDESPGVRERGERLTSRLRAGEELEADEAVEGLVAQATGHRERQLEALARFLFDLLRAAPGLSIALVPEASPAGLLDVSGLRLLYEEPSLAGVGYWHDVGVAQMRADLGLDHPGDWLDCEPARLLGVSLQDYADGQDRLQPGEGMVDWPLIADYLPQGALRVLALAPAYSGEALQEARRALASFGIP